MFRPLNNSFGTNVAHLLIIVGAIAAIGWVIIVAPKFWSEQIISEAAKHIITGEIYRPEIMKGLDAATKYDRAGSFRPSVLGKAAIIQLRVAENAVAAGDQSAIDAQLTSLKQSILISLTNAPSDSFLWLASFWLEKTRGSPQGQNLQRLRMSYATGPNEGWIAIKRNQMAIAMYAALPPDIAKIAMLEFAGLARSGFNAETANILEGPGWPIREVLLSGFKDVNINNRRSIARILYDDGFDGAVVPGIEARPVRPWR